MDELFDEQGVPADQRDLSEGVRNAMCGPDAEDDVESLSALGRDDVNPMAGFDFDADSVAPPAPQNVPSRMRRKAVPRRMRVSFM